MLRIHESHFYGVKMFIIGIAGGSGSGKTTFAHKIIKNFDKSQLDMLHMDSYYLDPQPESNISSDKNQPNFDHPDAFDWELLKNHLNILKNGGQVASHVYDFTTHHRTSEVITVGPCKVLLFEGILSLFKKEIREMLDIKCYLHMDSDIRFTRRLHRDYKERGRSLDSVISQYYETVRPMYQRFLAPQQQYADFIVGEESDTAARIISSYIRELLQSS